MDTVKKDKHPHRSHHRDADTAPLPGGHANAPDILTGLSADALKAVRECHETIGRHAYMPPPEEKPSEAVPKPRHPDKFMAKVNQIEDMTKSSLYTQERYDAELKRAKEYTDAFVSQLKLPAEGDELVRHKKALKEKFHAIIDGAAGMETGWSPDEVRGSAGRPHSGIYQTQWSYMKEARGVYEHIPAMKETLQANPKDYAVLELARHAPKGLPTTSFAGQGAAFAGMAVKSYQDFITRGGTPETFNGVVVYQEHLLGKSGAEKFRDALAENPDKKGKPGVGKPTYKGNYLMTDHPFAGLNDLNSDRLVYSAATPKEVDRMLRDKFIFAYMTREKKGASLEKLQGFEQAFLPEWSDPARKQSDIDRVTRDKKQGAQMRESPEIRADVCTVLMPMQAFNTTSTKAATGQTK